MAGKAKRKRRAKKRGSTRARTGRRPWLLGLLLTFCAVSAIYVGWLDWHVRHEFDGKRWSVPARLYARSLNLFPDERLTADEFERELRAADYHATARIVRPGSYDRSGETFRVATRAFRFWDGIEPARDLTVRFEGRRIAELEAGGHPLALARLDPALIGRIYPADHEDRVLVKLADVPRLLVRGLVAVEDRYYFEHHGLAPLSILRALVADLRAGAAVQGGSTLTQQLAKNFFLGPQRTLWRKVNEALIAVLLEAHYSKPAILEAYLNEIFLGQQGARAIHGFGLASYFYFGRPLDELEPQELALLIALVRGPSYYNPRIHPERARARRNLVLELMAQRGVISQAEAAAYERRPLGITPTASSGSSPYPAFVDLVRRQLQRDYRDADLRSEGLRIFTTLDPGVQRAAERALSERLNRLERAGHLHPETLEGAVVVTDPQSGEVLAVVGGRDPRAVGFDRALDAQRPVGSLLKPAIYLTALEHPDRYTLITPLDDSPVHIRAAGGRVWSPHNYDRTDHGRVPLYLALAHSYNHATVRLGMALGLGNVLATVRKLGVERDIPAYPATLLGAAGLSPLEVANMYQTIASGGFRTPLRAIRAVTDAYGKPLKRYGIDVSQAFRPAPIYLLLRAMEEVVRSGTARSVYRRLPASLTLAGKTGTTDDLRDSWFAGFGEDRLAVVWVGRDDNAPAGFTGASGALRVWTDLMAAIHPQRLVVPTPAGVKRVWTEVRLGRSTDQGCAGATPLPYIAGSTPAYRPCGGERLASGSAAPAAAGTRSSLGGH